MQDNERKGRNDSIESANRLSSSKHLLEVKDSSLHMLLKNKGEVQLQEINDRISEKTFKSNNDNNIIC